jgi:hypothetical protein
MNKIAALLCLCFLPFLSNTFKAQDSNPVILAVEKAKADGIPFEKVSVFAKSNYQNEEALRFATDGQMLKLFEAKLTKILADQPEAISLEVPFHGELFRIDMIKVQVCSEDFTVVTSASNGAPVPYEGGVHYRGYLPNEPQSIAAFSFFKHDIMGFFATQGRGNMVVGQLEAPVPAKNYICYSENACSAKNPFTCATNNRPINGNVGGTANGYSAEVNGCIRVYLESDFDLYTNKVTLSATVAHMQGAFNQVAALYGAVAVSTVVSQIFVWVESDPYTDTNAALDEFQALRGANYNGNLAHLLTLDPGGNGGYAYLDVLCSSSGHAYSDIDPSFQTVPTYSWTIMVMSHEMGHNVGSNHTQWCGWTAVTPPGALDNCYAVEGSCAQGPTPTNGGTIMSYCHTTGNGINLANGFGNYNGGVGTQPRNAVTGRTAAASCLTATCAAGNGCAAPTGITWSGTTNNSITLTWPPVSGATSYNAQYRVVGASVWTTITGVVSPALISGLPENMDIEIALQSVCGSNFSPFFIGLAFTTGANTGCPSPSNTIASAITATGATINWTENGTATLWDIYYSTDPTPPGPTTPPSVANTSTKPYNLTGLAGSTTYNVYIRSSCTGGVLSTWSGSYSFTTIFDCNSLFTATENVPFAVNIPAGTGNYNVASCGFSTPGKEYFFKFTPAQSGLYVFEVIDHSGEWIDYFYKVNAPGVCNGTGYTCVDDLNSPTVRGIGMLAAGTTYQFLADAEGNTQASNATIKIHRAISIANSDDNSCNTYAVVAGMENDNSWRMIAQGGSYVGAIKAASTTSLGTVSVEMADYATSPSSNGIFHLSRYANFEAEPAPTGNVQIVLFYGNDELTQYNTASGLSATISTLGMSYWDGPAALEDCSPSNNTGGSTGSIAVTTAFPFGSNHFGLFFQTNHFTEFVAAQGFVALPVELVKFRGSVEKSGNLLTWETASEVNVANQILEKSFDGISWTMIYREGSVPSSELKKYSFTDLNPGTVTYYRLQFEDLDGSKRYSNQIVLERADRSIQITDVFPNPANELLNIKTESGNEMDIEFQLIDLLGRVVLQKYAFIQKGIADHQLTINELPIGHYRLSMKNTETSEVIQSKAIIVSH